MGKVFDLLPIHMVETKVLHDKNHVVGKDMPQLSGHADTPIDHFTVIDTQ
jgi:hypothetical protein